MVSKAKKYYMNTSLCTITIYTNQYCRVLFSAVVKRGECEVKADHLLVDLCFFLQLWP